MYKIYIVSSDEDFDFFKTNYQEVKDLAHDYIVGDNLADLLKKLVSGLNGTRLSNVDYYFLTDEDNGIILNY